MSNPYEQYPPAGNTPNPYGGQPYGVAPQEHPQGTVVLILGILGFFVGVTAPFAWYLGNKAIKEIRASGRSYSNEQLINIGRILGMIMTLLYVLVLVLVIVFAIIAVVASSRG
jgi:hypothetical protein